MRLGRRVSPEEKAWRELIELWDASLGEIKVKVDRIQRVEAEAVEEENRDQRG